MLVQRFHRFSKILEYKNNTKTTVPGKSESKRVQMWLDIKSKTGEFHVRIDVSLRNTQTHNHIKTTVLSALINTKPGIFAPSC